MYIHIHGETWTDIDIGDTHTHIYILCVVYTYIWYILFYIYGKIYFKELAYSIMQVGKPKIPNIILLVKYTSIKKKSLGQTSNLEIQARGDAVVLNPKSTEQGSRLETLARFLCSSLKAEFLLFLKPQFLFFKVLSD